MTGRVAMTHLRSMHNWLSVSRVGLGVTAAKPSVQGPVWYEWEAVMSAKL